MSSITALPIPPDETDDATRKGLVFYETRLKPILEPAHNGQVVAIHPDSEDYVVAP